MKLQLEIDCSSDAFHPDPRHQVRRILDDLSRRLGVDEALLTIGTTLPCSDENGNTCGRLEITT